MQKSAVAWHAAPLEEVFQRLEASQAGLTAAEAAARLQTHGPNLLPEEPPTPMWQVFLRQFNSPLIYILLVAAGISIVLGEAEDAGFIFAVLVINAIIGAYQELHAERSSRALRKLLRIHSQVVRDGEPREIEASEIVPGDVVWLESGNRVPADIRLISTQGMEVDESLLTGESVAVLKEQGWQGSEAASLGDRLNMAFAGSTVARGRAQGIVVATAAATHLGELAVDVMASTGGKPPLIERMERFTNQVAIGTMVAVTVIGAIGYFFWQYSLVETFFFVVALAVSAIPEGLPVAMTIALSVATIRMARRRVIVRRLTAVEGLGSCTLIATDKTGTITCNELTVREIRLATGEVISVTGEGFAPSGSVQLDDVSSASRTLLESAVRAGVLCNEADLHQRDGVWTWRGDAVDLALLSLGHKLGLTRERLQESSPQIQGIPYEPERQFAATFHRHGEKTVVYVKGAPERVLEMCGRTISPELRRTCDQAATEMAQHGLRVLALASGQIPESVDSRAVVPDPADLEFLGFVGMIDPLRPGAQAAIEQCHAAGVEVSMVTGDHRVTALAIARELGLAEHEGQVVSGPEIEPMSPQALQDCLRNARVFARVTPRQKLQIVEAARQIGHCVAVTGDGVNDAPALRAANIGVAMGKAGTDVAREAADLVVSDDNFASIVAGIEEGRIAYDNIRKVIFLLISMGMAELVMVLLAVSTGIPVPLLPVQLLWLNLVTDGIQAIALAFEPGEGDTLKRQPRPPQEPIFNRLMAERLGVASLVVGVGGYLTYAIALQLGWETAAARNLLLLVMVLYENFHIGNCRSETKSAFSLSPLRSPTLLMGTLGALLVHILAMHLPFMQSILSTQPVSWQVWLTAILIAVTVVPAMEIQKWLWARRNRP